MKHGASLPHYFVAETFSRDQAIWRVVREEHGRRGMKVFSHICGCGTRRAAQALAQALSDHRAPQAPDTAL
jgi:hypothetical protein